MGALKGKELEIGLYLTTIDEKVREKVLEKREILNSDPRLSTSIKIELIPPSSYFTFAPNRVILDLSSYEKLDESYKYGGIINTQNTSKVLIVTYERRTTDIYQNIVYVDPTKVRALNVYSDRNPCRLDTTIRDNSVDIVISGPPSLLCEKYKIEDKEKDVAVVLTPVSLYSAKLTDKERERNFVISLFPENFKNDKGESVSLLLKITRI